MILYCTVLYCTVLYCTVLYCTKMNEKYDSSEVDFVHNLKSPNLDAQKFKDETTFNFETSLLLFIFRAEC